MKYQIIRNGLNMFFINTQHPFNKDWSRYDGRFDSYEDALDELRKLAQQSRIEVVAEFDTADLLDE